MPPARTVAMRSRQLSSVPIFAAVLDRTGGPHEVGALGREPLRDDAADREADEDRVAEAGRLHQRRRRRRRGRP